MTHLLDTNCLIALAWENHDDHDKAHRWLRRVKSFATCPITQGGFIRISSHPALGFANGPADAFASLDSILGDERHKFIADDLSFDASEIGREAITGHGKVTDHYLAALARRHKASLATFDEPLAKSFSGEAGLVTLIP